MARSNTCGRMNADNCYTNIINCCIYGHMTAFISVCIVLIFFYFISLAELFRYLRLASKRAKSDYRIRSTAMGSQQPARFVCCLRAREREREIVVFFSLYFSFRLCAQCVSAVSVSLYIIYILYKHTKCISVVVERCIHLNVCVCGVGLANSAQIQCRPSSF